MASYRLRALARDDLEAIWDHTVVEWGIKQAERYLGGLFACFVLLGRSGSIIASQPPATAGRG